MNTIGSVCRGKRTFDCDVVARKGVSETKTGAVQHEPREFFCAGIVKSVAAYGVSDICRVHAYLMRSSAEQCKFCERIFVYNADSFEQSLCGLAVF